MNFKCLIVDDEPLARKLLRSHVVKIEGLDLIGECGDAIEASNFLRHQQVDLILLDIQMPEVSGLQFINTLNTRPAIIFTTAYRDFAPEAFDLDVVDYLLKPISFERLLKAVNKFFERRVDAPGQINVSKGGDEYIFIKADRKMHKVAVPEIVFVESLDDYVKIHLKTKVLVSRENISTLAERLATPFFVRIHRSFIVSARFVSSVSTEGVDVNGKLLPFGRAYKLSALAALGIRTK